MIEDSVAHALRAAQRVVIFSGAGMSAESGIPTFRDRMTGLWAHTDPMEIATPDAFRANPQRVWDWHVHLAETMRKAAPNAGHRAVAALQERVPGVTVITQNIDNLHQAAGSRTVHELHGNIFRLKSFVDEERIFASAENPVICPVCDSYADHAQCDPYAGKEDFAALRLEARPVPVCPGCGAWLRPDIVWFGEPLDPAVLDAAWDATDDCDAMICIGASLAVQPAASLPWRALQNGAIVIEVNPQPTELADYAAASLSGGAAEILPRLFRDVWANK